MKNGLIIADYGAKLWYKDDKLHRDDDLPAVEYPDGSKYWYQHGIRHRVKGPAIEFPKGYKSWYCDGERINVDSQEEFERYLNLIAFM